MSREQRGTRSSLLDRDLVARYVAGDEAAFEEIVRRYASMVFNVAVKITGNREDAEDATQDAFSSLAEKLHRFENRSQLKTWIYRVGMNAALMVVRCGRRHRHATLDATGAAGPEGDPSFEPVDPAPSAENEVLGKEAERQIRAAIQRLPEGFRAVVVLAEVERLTNREVGEILGLSVPAVKSRLHRARLRLRHDLAAYFERTPAGDAYHAPSAQRACPTRRLDR